MESQADQLLVASAQQLVRGPVGEDELALRVGLDQRHGHRGEDLVQARLVDFRLIAEPVALDCRISERPGRPAGEEKEDQRQPCGHRERQAQQGNPVDIAFHDHTRTPASGSSINRGKSKVRAAFDR